MDIDVSSWRRDVEQGSVPEPDRRSYEVRLSKNSFRIISKTNNFPFFPNQRHDWRTKGTINLAEYKDVPKWSNAQKIQTN